MWTNEYRHALSIGVLVVLHLGLSLFITGLLLLLSPKYGEADPADPEHPGFPHNHSTTLMLGWATVLGLTATVLAAVQFVPQLWHTWTLRLVGCKLHPFSLRFLIPIFRAHPMMRIALSIPTMLIQTRACFVWQDDAVADLLAASTAGSFVFVYSYLAGGGRPGTNWTTWLVYLVRGARKVSPRVI